jgi:hypothetical protein
VGGTRKLVRLTVDLTFEGDYYDAGELVGVASDWVHAGLEDRDDLRGATVSGEVLAETEITA